MAVGPPNYVGAGGEEFCATGKPAPAALAIVAFGGGRPNPRRVLKMICIALVGHPPVSCKERARDDVQRTCKERA